MATSPKIMAVQGAAVLVGAAFLVVGVLGFIPGVTTHYDQLHGRATIPAQSCSVCSPYPDCTTWSTWCSASPGF